MEFFANGRPGHEIGIEEVLVMASITHLRRDGKPTTAESIQADLKSDDIEFSEGDLHLILRKLFNASFVSRTEDIDRSQHYGVTSAGHKGIKRFLRSTFDLQKSE